MIIVQMSSNHSVMVTRESLHGVIYSLLSDSYHNHGIGVEFPNHDTMRGHTFFIKTGEYPAGVPILLEFRGIDAIERSFENAIKQVDSLRIKDTVVQIDQIYTLKPALSRQFKTGKPILTRISADRPEAKNIIRVGQKTAYLTHNDDPETWVSAVQHNLKRRGQALMGDLFVKEYGEPVIRIIGANDVRDRIVIKYRDLVVRGTEAVLEISDTAWAEVAYRIGLGERCTYGFGVLKALSPQKYVAIAK